MIVVQFLVFTMGDKISERKKMTSGQHYDPMDAQLVKDRLRARKLTRGYNTSIETDGASRTMIMRELLGTLGKNPYIEPTFKCDYGYNIHLGDNFYANFDCIFLDVAEIHIGDNCYMAPRVQLYTASHPINAKERISGVEFGKSIKIGNNAWIGGGAIINPGESW